MSSGRWDEACRREEAVRELLGRNPDGLAQLASSLAHHVFCPQISIERGRAGGVQPTAATARLHLPLEKKRSMASVCSMTTPSEASRHGRHQLTRSGSCLSAAIRNRSIPKHWIETLKVLDLVVPGIDRHTAANGATTPPANKPVLPLSLRPTLLAGVATVERSGPKIIAELHGRTIGAHHAHFGAIAAGIVASSRPDT